MAGTCCSWIATAPPGATHLLDADAKRACRQRPIESWPSLLNQEPETGLHMRASPIPGSACLISPAWATSSVNGGTNDLIILDCPPSSASADSAMLTRLADRCVLVASGTIRPAAIFGR